jgi:hypothetical protein
MTNVSSIGNPSANLNIGDAGQAYSQTNNSSSGTGSANVVKGPEKTVGEPFINSAQFNALSEKEKVAQIEKMSPAQVAKLIDALPDKYVGMLKSSQMVGLTPLQVKAKFSPLSWEALSGLSIKQRANLSSGQNWNIEKNRTPDGMSEAKLLNLSPEMVALCISGMSGSEAKLLKPGQLSLLTPEQVKENFSPLSWKALASLSLIQRGMLTSEQNLSIEENRYPEGLTGDRLYFMDSSILDLCVAAMSEDQLYAIPPEKLTINQVLALPDKQAKALTGYDSKELATMTNGRLEHHDDSTPTDVDPNEAITGFTQGKVGNCVAISAIKATMVKYGEDPADVFQDVKMDGQGWKITMRDGYNLTLSFAEVKLATEKSDFREIKSKSMWKSANFIYAAMAKRASKEGNDGKNWMSYNQALDSLNGESSGDEGLYWIGIKNYQKVDKARLPYVEAAVVTLYTPGKSYGHSTFSGGEKMDDYGKDIGTGPKATFSVAEVFQII